MPLISVRSRRSQREETSWRNVAISAIPAILLLLCLAVYLPTSQVDDKVSVDVYSSSLASWRIAETGTPWLDGFDTTPIAGYGDLPDKVVFIGDAANGHRVPLRLPGVVAVAVPAYWLLSDGDAASDFSMAPQAWTAAVITAGTVVLFFLSLRRILGHGRAALAAGVLALATPVWSVAANAMWTHTLSIFGIAGMAWAASRNRWWLVGVFGGVAIWGRLHVAVVVAIVGLACAYARRSPRLAIQVGVPSAGFLLLACAWTRVVYGTWIPGTGYSMSATSLVAGGRFPDPPPPWINQLGLWISPDKGILVWSPLIVLLLPAIVRACRTAPIWMRSLAAGGLAYTLLQGQVNHYTGGGAHYGYRLGLEFLVCLAPLCAYAAPYVRTTGKKFLAPVVGLQIAAIGVGALLDGPAPAASYGWSNNAFLVALEIAPALGVVTILLVALFTVCVSIGGTAPSRSGVSVVDATPPTT